MTTDELLQRWSDGSITASELHELTAKLDVPEHQSALLDDWLLESSLPSRLPGASVAALPGALRTSSQVKGGEPPPTSRPTQWLSWRSLAAAAVFTLAASGWFWLQTPAILVEVEAATPGTGLVVGERVSLKKIQFAQGSARLRLESGVVMDCEAPFEARFESHARLRLAEGRLNVDVGERGFGFTVVTAAGEVVDLGTAFGIEATRDGSASVAVLSGKVEVKQRHQAALPLVEGEGVRLRSQQSPERLLSVRLVEQGGITRLDWSTPADAALVGEVTDNLKLPGLHRYYAIISGGMRPGATAFADRVPPRWLPYPGEDFPEELKGGDLVQTFHERRQTPAFQLSLQLLRPSIIYVLHDPRHAVPEWLARDFAKTSMRLRSGPWPVDAPITVGLEPGANAQFHVSYEVWRREQPGPGTLVLGSPFNLPGVGVPSMYGLVVKPLESPVSKR